MISEGKKTMIDVLIVDDSNVMRTMIRKTMQMSGLPIGTLYEAANGKEGLDVLGSHWVDLIIADINMPVMNGEEMISRIRENTETRDIAIIVVSTEGSSTRIERLLEKNVTFIKKPFTPEIIRDTVATVMGIEV